jgi:V-type H+-transporting ATPase subunit D
MNLQCLQKPSFSGAMTAMKGRLKGAQKGHSLLKKKADALQFRFRLILKKIVETKQTMGEVMKEAAFSLAEAKFATGDFSQVSMFKSDCNYLSRIQAV